MEPLIIAVLLIVAILLGFDRLMFWLESNGHVTWRDHKRHVSETTDMEGLLDRAEEQPR